MLQPTIKRSRDRVEPKRATPVRISSAAKAGSVLTVTFDQAVRLKGVPQYTLTGAIVTPLSAAMTSPTVMALTFSGSITAATVVHIPFEDPAIRNAVGGFVADTTFPVT